MKIKGIDLLSRIAYRFGYTVGHNNGRKNNSKKKAILRNKKK